YHEAGHAIVSVKEPASDPIHKATIIPRGRALGMVMRLPERDSYSYHRDKMHANLSVAMGGRVAEELIFGHEKVSSGASSDIQYATSLARNMVTQWGMSDKLGPLQYEETQEGYLGYGGSQRTFRSGKTNDLIDAEIKGLVEGAHKRATDILKTHEDKLHLLANALLEYETLTGDEINQLMDSGKLDRPDRPSGPAAPNPVKGSAIPKAGKRFSGADLANLVNEAALLAARRNKRLVAMQEFEDAKDKVMMGAERKSMAMNEEEKRLTASHEGGHASVAMNVK
ncbi:MAG: hypothetical protein ACK44O_05425, partial [Novosphingobium sp.]